MADSRYARSSEAVIGRRSVSVPGLGMIILDMWCAGWGMVRISREILMILVRVRNQGSVRRANILIENWRCRLFLGVLRIDERRVVMYAGSGAFGCM